MNGKHKAECNKHADKEDLEQVKALTRCSKGCMGQVAELASEEREGAGMVHGRCRAGCMGRWLGRHHRDGIGTAS